VSLFGRARRPGRPSAPDDLRLAALERLARRREPRRPAEPPFFTECVIGYRQWLADPVWDELRPIGGDVAPPWEPGVNTARCHRPLPIVEIDGAWEQLAEHAAPDGDCQCGLYSLRRLYRGWFLNEDGADERTVVGAVASWGRIEVHPTGIRAEHACIVALVHRSWFGPDRDTVERIAEHYGVEVVGLRGLEAAAMRHGAPLPDSRHGDIRFS
jgi:hypothetical protein